VGSIRFIDAPEKTLLLVREHEQECILGAFNLSGESVTAPLPANSRAEPLAGHGFLSSLSASGIALPPYGAFFGRLEAVKSGG
jgi:alpha-glucosidase